MHINHNEKYIKKRERRGKIFKTLFLIGALVSVLSLGAIIFFVFSTGIKPFLPWAEYKYSFVDFISGLEWRPGAEKFGILFMIAGSVYATIGAIILGVPIAILTAVFITKLAPKRIAGYVSFGIELLSGIPSVLYGVFGLGLIVPWIMNFSPMAQGQSLFAAILVLTIMILPTVTSITQTAILSVPKRYEEGSLALGASKIQTIFKVIIPAAKSGILAGIVLGIGRAIGETMAIMLVCGNSIAGLPNSIFSQIRPLTTGVALEMGYASGLHQDLLFSIGIVLFVFIMIVNIVLHKITKKMVS